MSHRKIDLRHGTLLVLILILSLPLSAADSRAPVPDSILLTLEGKVETAPSNQAVWSPGQTNQTLRAGDRLRTGVRSRSTVRLSNLTVLRVNELTTLQIQPPSATGKQNALDLQRGAAYFFSRQRPTEVEFRTPLASAAIRGTEFHLAVADDGTTRVTMIDGEVALSNERGGVQLASGEEGIVEPGKAPRKTAVIETINIIQWCLYYPAILDLDELKFTDAEKQILTASLDSYRSGDLLNALENYPANRAAVSDAEKIYLAGLLLSVGQVEQAETQLIKVDSPLAEALRGLVLAVKHQAWPRSAKPALASELMADSYYLQSQDQLEAARNSARAATEKSPNFGFAWERLAELEFSFGRVPEALAALDKSLELSPRNAQAHALKGFILAAQNKIPAAQNSFEEAIAIDGALGNAWLGLGLTKIRQGNRDDGLRDLQTAAVLEPHRAVLRSYLGKAFSNARDNARADKEFNLAKRFDPNDPTAWLYSALLAQQENKVNEAVRDLEKSRDLNDNRRIYRSRLLLDQDRAVRGANLAAIYRDAGMTDWSVREASRAVNSDYANYSAHQFLANSYDALRDPKQINLRYETPWFSELLLSQLLSPVGAGNLSAYVSQQEYSKLFERDGPGIASATEYFSSGDWHQAASQFGTFGNLSYALDVDYRSQRGQRPNNDLELASYDVKTKAQLTPQDTIFVGAFFYDAESGDVAQYYNQNSSTRFGFPMPSPTFRLEEKQEPNLFVAHHHEWGPGSHTLFLFSLLDDTLAYEDPNAQIPFIRHNINSNGVFAIERIESKALEVEYERRFEAYSAELQQIWQRHENTLVAGVRYQIGWADTTDGVGYGLGQPSFSAQHIEAKLERASFYAYDHLQICDQLQATAGFSYDRLHYPRNVDTSPLSTRETDAERISPKAGIVWSPFSGTHLRGVYTRSFGGVFYDTSVRLEPTQVAGFNQAFRSLAPEAAVGLVPGTRFETFGLALEQAFKTRTYFNVEAELLSSEASRTVGVFTNHPSGLIIPQYPSGTQQRLEFEERTLLVTLNQLVGRDWSLGARYRLSEADLNGRFTQLAVTTPGVKGRNQNETAILHQINFFAGLNHPSGFFARGEGVWTQQSNRGYSPDIPGDDFWQFNLFAGYRFYHRAAEMRLGLLNLTDQDYRLNPLNLYYELPRQRAVEISFKIYF